MIQVVSKVRKQLYHKIMNNFDESLGFKVYVGPVDDHILPSDLPKHFNSEKITKGFKTGDKHEIITLDSIRKNYTIRYALNHALRNYGLINDRKITEIVNFKPNKSDYNESETKVYNFYQSNLKLAYVNPKDLLDLRSSNDPSYYHLYSSLLRSVNSVLEDPSPSNLKDLEESSENLDSCLFTELSKEYIADILEYYKRIGAVDFTENYTFSPEGVRGVTLLDPGKLTRTGKSKSFIGFSFSPAGFLIPYHLGVISYLCEYNLVNCTVPLAGGSAGALTVCSTCTNLGFINSLNTVEKLSKKFRCEISSTINDLNSKDSDILSKEERTLDALLKFYLYDLLEEGVQDFINNRIGNVKVAYSVIRGLKFENRLSSKFDSLEDMIDCLRVSSFLPLVSAKHPVIYKGEPCYDAQLSLSKCVACPETDAERTVRINPYKFTSSLISKQILLNDYITPHLTKSDKFLIYYVRLKSFIYRLNLRKIELEEAKKGNQFPIELIHSINLYHQIISYSNYSRTSYKETKDYTKLCDYWNSEELMDLFVLIVLNEKNLRVDKYNLKRYESNYHVDILNKFGSKRIFKKRVETTPFTLLTCLQLHLSKYTLPSPISFEPGNISSRISNVVGPGIIKDTKIEDRENKENIEIIENLVSCIIPPLVLIYNYCNHNDLIYNHLSQRQMFKVSLFSSDNVYLRFLYDLGRAEAFRWIVHEYIKFENYLYLKLFQLKNLKTDQPISNRKVNTKDVSLDELQNKLLTNSLNVIYKKTLKKQSKFDSVHFKFFKKLNILVRNAINTNCVDSHFLHILSHSHFWDYNKHYRF